LTSTEEGKKKKKEIIVILTSLHTPHSTRTREVDTVIVDTVLVVN
jgi:hypothetical protein